MAIAGQSLTAGGRDHDKHAPCTQVLQPLRSCSARNTGWLVVVLVAMHYSRPRRHKEDVRSSRLCNSSGVLLGMLVAESSSLYSRRDDLVLKQFLWVCALQHRFSASRLVLWLFTAALRCAVLACISTGKKGVELAVVLTRPWRWLLLLILVMHCPAYCVGSAATHDPS